MDLIIDSIDFPLFFIAIIIWAITIVSIIFYDSIFAEEKPEEEEPFDYLIKKNQIDYSNQILEFTRTLIGQITILKARTYSDTHDLSMGSKAQISSLAKEVAETFKNSLNPEIWDTIKNKTFYTREFYINYIVETSIIMVKDIHKKMVDDYYNIETEEE
jgi:sulfur relay (sulfurtransferase) DsrC/TusE family protein